MPGFGESQDVETVFLEEVENIIYFVVYRTYVYIEYSRSDPFGWRNRMMIDSDKSERDAYAFASQAPASVNVERSV